MENRVCRKCVMDNTDPTIVFDGDGICDYCHNFEDNILPNWKTDAEGLKTFKLTLQKIKNEGRAKDYDCLIGISGGLDSSYLAHVAVKEFGLRPLFFHVDAGWNSDVSTRNIQNLMDGLEVDLYTEVINWEEMKDLQRAFIKSQVPDIDTPQDFVFFSSLYNYAAKNGYKYILTGSNHSTECVREPLAWGAYYQTDTKYINDIHKQFGEVKLSSFPQCDIFKYKIVYRLFYGVRVVKPLNSIPFVKKDAESLLNELYGWQPYQHKHHESRFTRFYESFWLPRKFGFDKRKNHLSSLILTGQSDRDEVLDRISRPELPEEELMKEFEYVAKKLDFSVEELWDYFKGENKTFKDYKNNYKLIQLGTRIMQFLGLENRAFK